ncbi:hypothetical protein B0T22DRAFT_449284 [Podospora appendiculata]|uniref:Ecp2 effector protein domain-containing protein n=1 Tax=Podospora appendiculata TaxID=314037 RepID=A0AAE1CGA4_9PEZI|nr:hypothetical protein B0T22DRAFT_449284 [Podospora appendiculata]
MLFTTAILLLPIAAPLISAFSLHSKNITNGIFKAYHDKTGNEVHEILTLDGINKDAQAAVASGVAVATRSLDKNPHVARFDTARRSWCGCGLNMDHSDCDNAVELLKRQIRAHNGQIFVPIGQAYYSIYGNVVAFVCSPGSNSAITGITESSFTWALGFLTDHCGRYVPGTYIEGAINVAGELEGYMEVNGGVDFCAKSTSSSSWNCGH